MEDSVFLAEEVERSIEFGDLTLVHDEDTIGVDDGSEPMSDDEKL